MRFWRTQQLWYKHWNEMFPPHFSLSYKTEKLKSWERETERETISGHWLLIPTRHTSPQLSQIAIEKWPVMQLLANPGPWLPSIIKSCLTRGLLSRLSWCIVSLSHLLGTSSPAASARSGIRFPSTASHSVEHIRWYGPTRRNWNCCIIYSNGSSQGEVMKVTE